MTAQLLLCLLLLSCLPAAAQVVEPYRVPVGAQEAVDTVGLREKPPRKPSLSGARFHIEQMPMFKGGFEALFCFMYRNNRFAAPDASYPTGRVFVEFVIDTAGHVQDARLLNGLHPELDAEALRLVKLMSGHFTPGYNHKRPVAVPFTLPIHFPATAPAGRKQRKRCP